MNNINDLAMHVSNLAVKALVYEVSVSPKMGLVDRYNNGSHKDMNFFTFIDSSFSLQNYFMKAYLMGNKYGENYLEEENLKKLRSLGMDAENSMLNATSGINCHKGIIYSLGILIYALGSFQPEENIFYSTLEKKIVKTGWGMEGNFYHNISPEKEKVTHGDKVFLKYKIRGIREEVSSGIPSLGKSLSVFRYLSSLNIPLNDIGTAVLLYLNTILEDTNIISRSNLETSNKIKLIAGEIWENISLDNLADTDYRNKYLLEPVMELDKKYTKLHISPGGCADILALNFFLYFLTESNHFSIVFDKEK